MFGHPVTNGLSSERLCTFDSLCRHQVRPGSLPSSWQGSTMEINHQMISCRIFEDSGIQGDNTLFIRVEEIHLYTLHSKFTDPLELFGTLNVGRHYAVITPGT